MYLSEEHLFLVPEKTEFKWKRQFRNIYQMEIIIRVHKYLTKKKRKNVKAKTVRFSIRVLSG